MDILFGAEVYGSALRVFANFALVAGVVSLVIWFAALSAHGTGEADERVTALAMIFAVALLGGMTGYAGGNSREGVVGDVIPAVLTFLSGAVLYFFGLKRQAAPITPFLLSAFVVVLFIGYGMGAKKRQLFDDSRARTERQLQTCLDVFSNADVLGSDKAVQNAALLFGDNCAKIVNLDNLQSPGTP